MGKPDNGVAAFDVMIKKVEGLAGDMRLKPERNLAQLRGKGVFINTVDAVAYGVTHSGPVCRGGGLIFAGAYPCKLGADTAGGIEKNVPASCRNITYPDGEKSFLRVFRFQPFINNVVKRMLDKRLYQLVRCVVCTCGRALGTSGKDKSITVALLYDLGGIFEQAFIYRTKLFCIKRGIVYPDLLPGCQIGEYTQVFKTGKQRVVIKAALVQNPECLIAEQLTGKGFYIKVSSFGIGFKQAESIFQGGPKVIKSVFLKKRPFTKPAEAVDAVVVVINITLYFIGILG